MAIASMFTGTLSDKIGRKPVLLGCIGGSIIATAFKWFARSTFWGFCGANLVNGLLSGGFPVAMAYVGEVFAKDTIKKQSEFGIIGGLFVLGNASGGIIAILMEPQGLFAPLWVGVFLLFVTLVVVSKYLIEPGNDLHLLALNSNDNEDKSSAAKEGGMATDHDTSKNDHGDDPVTSSSSSSPPKEMSQWVLWNIILGALADNFGSNGLFPLCLSPLAFNHWTMNFLENLEEPILSLNGYKWMATLVALVVVPSTVIAPTIFNVVGPAGGCVFGNIATGILTIILLQFGTQEPTKTWLVAFVVTTYVGFPFTVISQLSTGPMLDLIAPAEKRGYVQGLNSTVMNLGTAIAPWILGILADTTTTDIAIWAGAGISFWAAFVNAPLMKQPGMGFPPKELPLSHRPLQFEDKKIVEKILRGDYVPGAVRDKINDERVKNGQPYLVPRTTSYEQDKTKGLDELRRNAYSEFAYLRARNHERLVGLASRRSTITEQENEVQLTHILRKVNESLSMVDETEVDNVHKQLGEWFAHYIKDSGYYAHVSPVLVKQMILAAFPVLTPDKQFTADNLEQFLVNEERVHAQYMRVGTTKPGGHSLRSILGDGVSKNFYG